MQDFTDESFGEKIYTVEEVCELASKRKCIVVKRSDGHQRMAAAFAQNIQAGRLVSMLQAGNCYVYLPKTETKPKWKSK